MRRLILFFGLLMSFTLVLSGCNFLERTHSKDELFVDSNTRVGELDGVVVENGRLRMQKPSVKDRDSARVSEDDRDDDTENEKFPANEAKKDISEENSPSLDVDAPSTQDDAPAIMTTDGVKHSVPLDEILDGGPPKDGIPPIDNPKFWTVAEANKEIGDDEPGIAFSLDNVDRFYPFSILVWHEIVNDQVNGKRFLVTYCPLCLSGIVFDPIVQGERVEFGTSGKLWNSNLVMYDRKTNTYWSQVLGEAIKGELTGEKLAVLSSDQILFGKWKAEHPNGQVLSDDTGFTRNYDQDPYGDYYTSSGTIFPLTNDDNRLFEKDLILGIVFEGQAKAYLPEAVKEKGEVIDEFAGRTIVAQYFPELDTVRLFERKDDGTLIRINPFTNFWFSWAAAHPNTELYK